MHLKLHFNFRNKTYSCDAYIDISEYPCYLFLDFSDKELIDEFGNEISLETDFEKLLPKKDDYPRLVMLRQAILNSIKQKPEYGKAKQQCEQKKISVYKQA